MSYSSIAIANGFLELAALDERELPSITNMKLQKLVYIAHGFTLAMLGDPLISSHVHAFQWGPVMPVLYQACKKFGDNPIPGALPVLPEMEPLDINHTDFPEVAIVQGVWDRYGQLTAAQLSNITHKPGTPWSLTWESTPFGVIPNDLIASHYLGLLEKV